MANHRLTDFLARLVRRENLNREEAFELLEALLDAEATDAQISGALVALASKGETVEELTGMAEGLRSRAVRLDIETHVLYRHCRNRIESREDFQHLNGGGLCHCGSGIAGRETRKSRGEQQVGQRRSVDGAGC